MRSAPLLLLMLIQTSVFSAEMANNWPCVQRLVPTLTASRYWSAPITLTDAQLQATKDEGMANLVDKLTTLSLEQGQADQLLNNYLLQHPLDKKQRQRLFLSLFASSNTKRNQLIDSIQTFTQSQQILAARISKQLETMDDKNLTEDKRNELQQQHQWDLRVYTQKESNLQLLCEKPVLLEQRLTLLAKRLQE